MTKVNNLKRQGYNSRTSLKRKLETAARADKKRKIQENEGESHFINRLLQETMFANTKRCIKCHSNVNLATEVTEDLTNENFHNRRDGRFWLCKFCLEKDESVVVTKSQQFTMQAIISEGKTVYIPKFIGAAGIGVEDEDDNDDQHSVVIDPSSKISFPVGTECLHSFPPHVQLKSLSGFQVQQLLHKGNALTSDNLSLLYEHQVHKYKKSKSRQDLFVAKIIDTENRILSNAKPCPMDKRISGSALWKSKQDQNVISKMEQLGSYALFIEINLPVKSSVAASVLCQEAKVISVDMVGGMTQELQRVYNVHRNHNSDTDCTMFCQKIRLEDYLEENNLNLELTNRNLSTYIEVSDLFTKSFIQNVLKSPASILCAENYHLQTIFKEDSSCKVLGISWPNIMMKKNRLNIDQSLSEEDKCIINREYVKSVGNSITTSSDAAVLKEIFHLTDVEARVVVELVEKYQICCCRSCPKCEDLELPSLELTQTISSESLENVVTSTRIRNLFLEKLKNLSNDDLRSLKTMEWIEEVSELIEDNHTNEANIWSIQIEDDSFDLFLDEILTNLILKYARCPLAAAYQYSVMCLPIHDQHKVILKREKLIESYTEPYNPFYLKAADAPISVKPVCGSREWKDFKYKHSDAVSLFSSDQPGLPDHSNISPGEVVSLSDKDIKNVKASTSVEFLYTGPDCKTLFKKVEKKTDKSYIVDGENVYLELQESIITKYFKRLNGLDLLLCEFFVWFDFLGEEKSESLSEVYGKKIDKIEDSSDTTLMGKELVPELVLCDNNNVFQKRKRPKILTITDFDVESYEYRYSQVILFGNNINFDDLTKEFVDEKFGDRDENGDNILKRNRRRFLLKMRTGIK